MKPSSIKKITSFLDQEFEKGIGLRGKEQKAFSGPSLEESCGFIIDTIIDDLKQIYPHANIRWDKKYIKSDYKGCCRERLDKHVYVNERIVFLQEDRAWVDKPFYSLKRGVIRNMMISCASKIHQNVKVCYVGYCLDYSQAIINTCNLTQGYGDIIKTFSITGRKRNMKVNGKKVNWYETGYDKKTVIEYAEYIYKTLEDAINEAGDTVSGRLFA